MFEAIRDGDIERVQQLIDSDPALAQTPNADGLTPVLWALYTNHAEIAQALLTRIPEALLSIHEAAATGADVNSPARNSLAVAPLHSALAGPQPDLARRLLAAGADANARQSGHAVPLHTTAYVGLLELTSLLLQHGADPTVANDQGRTPEAVARERGHTEVADVLASASRSR